MTLAGRTGNRLGINVAELTHAERDPFEEGGTWRGE